MFLRKSLVYGTVRQLLAGFAMNPNRYVYLDGIRGIAAIFVVIYHTSALWKFNLPHGYLAVDLFFILSGFVIAHAYDGKLKNKDISILQFVRVRLTRLYPIYILSVIVCVPLLLKGALPDMPSSFADPSVVDIFTLTIRTAIFLPFYGLGVFALFPMNQPYWSLFFELITNFVYAVARPILSDRLLVTVVILAAFGLGFVVKYFGKLNVGADWNLYGVIGGFIRAVFGVSAGLLLYRRSDLLKHCCKISLIPWLGVFVIPLILVLPSFGKYDGIIDLLSVLIIFPAAVIAASNGKATKFNRILVVLGTASYPLYVLHFPVSQMLVRWTDIAASRWAPMSGLTLIFGLIVASIWLENYYDIPARRWLSKLGKNGAFNPRATSAS